MDNWGNCESLGKKLEKIGIVFKKLLSKYVLKKDYEENIKKYNDTITKIVAEINRLSVALQNINSFAVVINSKISDIIARLDAIEGKKTFH